VPDGFLGQRSAETVIIANIAVQEVLSSVEVYDPRTGSWSYLTSLTTRRSGVSAVLLGDKIYVLGGFDGQERWDRSNKFFMCCYACCGAGAPYFFWEVEPLRNAAQAANLRL
jgi:Kelch motif